MVSDGEDALDLLVSGHLAATMLSPVGKSLLWGDPEKEGKIFNSRQALKSAGICTNPNGLFASPYWTGVEGGLGIQSRTALVRCDGTAAAREAVFELYQGYETEEEWLASGAMASQVLPLLHTVAATLGAELVCITPQLADQRREERGIKKAP